MPISYLIGMKPDTQLVADSLDGDERAFTELYLRHWTPILGYIKRMVSNEQVAEDIVQDAFIRIYDNLGKFDGSKSSFTTWAHTIAGNLAKNELSKINKRAQLRAKWMRNSNIVSEYLSETPEDEYDRKIRQERISLYASELTKNQRDAFILKDVYGKTIKETADELGISISATKNRLHRARKALREKIGKDELFQNVRGI